MDLRARFGLQLELIKNMGIEDEDSILMALLAANGNLEQALDQLVL